ncbi:hypothetical protein [Legionella pneumophila]|nr:hypothetical protein [Legionella pneumophila]
MLFRGLFVDYCRQVTRLAEANGHIRGTDIMTNKVDGGFIPYSAHVE